MGLFIATIFIAYALLPRSSVHPDTPGMDFIAFYSAGSFLRDGRADRLYDLRAIQQFQRELAKRSGLEIGQGYGPWWNPPFYALIFVPLAALSYQQALAVWLAISLLCAAAAAVLLCRMLPRGTSWKSWALIPVLMVLSTPFIFAMSHGQNTCTSLLLLCAAVMLWREERAIAAGIVGGLLFYKPQLAAVVALIMMLDLGWRAAVGYAITGGVLLLVNVILLPGTLADFAAKMPTNLHFAQTHSVYLWERHVTFQAFWRLLLQGREPGESATAVRVLAAACMAGIGIALVAAARRLRKCERQNMRAGVRDRLISATILCTPLLMPFYFDYDLLLLAIPAVLLASECMRRGGDALVWPWDRALLWLWPVFYVWLMLNPDVAERMRVNLAVPLLAGIAMRSIWRLRRHSPITAILQPVGACTGGVI